MTPKRGVLILSSVLVALATAELLARGLWRVRYGVPLSDPGKILYAKYPGLDAIDRARPSHDDHVYDVLLLGGSVLHPDWGEVESELLKQLPEKLGRPIRIFNLAQSAHTSRDSLLKYVAAGRARFDGVVIYDGINDTRTNNVPPELFQEDYSHYAWYEVVNRLATYHGHAWFALPYSAETLALWMKQTAEPNRYAPGLPKPEWTKYGGDVKSAASFSRNIESIVRLAAERGDHVILTTDSTHIAPGYSLQAFLDKRLDYTGHFKPIEIWGEPANVMKAVSRQNDALRALAAEHHDVTLVDEAALMPGSGKYFSDVCHLTPEGSKMFVEILVRNWPL